MVHNPPPAVYEQITMARAKLLHCLDTIEFSAASGCMPVRYLSTPATQHVKFMGEAPPALYSSN